MVVDRIAYRKQIDNLKIYADYISKLLDEFDVLEGTEEQFLVNVIALYEKLDYVTNVILKTESIIHHNATYNLAEVIKLDMPDDEDN